MGEFTNPGIHIKFHYDVMAEYPNGLVIPYAKNLKSHGAAVYLSGIANNKDLRPGVRYYVTSRRLVTPYYLTPPKPTPVK